MIHLFEAGFIDNKKKIITRQNCGKQKKDVIIYFLLLGFSCIFKDNVFPEKCMFQ
jgi:hypothetical protein